MLVITQLLLLSRVSCYLHANTLLRLQGLQPTRLLCPWDFPGKNTRMGCHFLLQGIFLTWGSNPSILYRQVDSLPLSHQGRPYYPLWSHVTRLYPWRKRSNFLPICTSQRRMLQVPRSNRSSKLYHIITLYLTLSFHIQIFLYSEISNYHSLFLLIEMCLKQEQKHTLNIVQGW